MSTFRFVRSSMIAALLASMSLTVPACSWFGKGAEEKVDAETLKKAISVAREIKKDPTKAGEALKTAELTRDELETILYKIAADDRASDEYAKALKGGGGGGK